MTLHGRERADPARPDLLRLARLHLLRRRPRPHPAGADQPAFERDQVLARGLDRLDPDRRQRGLAAAEGGRPGPRHPDRQARGSLRPLPAGRVRATQARRAAPALASQSAAASSSSTAALSGRSPTRMVPAPHSGYSSPAPRARPTAARPRCWLRPSSAATGASSSATTIPASASWSPSSFASMDTTSWRPAAVKKPSPSPCATQRRMATAPAVPSRPSCSICTCPVSVAGRPCSGSRIERRPPLSRSSFSASCRPATRPLTAPYRQRGCGLGAEALQREPAARRAWADP